MSGRTIVVYSPDYDHSLTHHGVRGQKWGIRRYQPYSTTGGRKSGKSGKEIGIAAKASKAASSVGAKAGSAIGRGIKAVIAGHKAKQAEKKAKVDAKKARKEQLKKEKSPTLNEVLKNKDKYTTKELTEMANRFAAEQKLKDIQQADWTRAANYMKAISSMTASAKVMGDVVSILATGKNIAEYRKDKIAADKTKKKEAGDSDDGSDDGSKPDSGSAPAGGKPKRRVWRDTWSDSDDGSDDGPGPDSGGSGGSGEPKTKKSGIFDTKSGSKDEGSSDHTEAFKSLSEAMKKYKEDHAHEATSLEFGGKVIAKSEPSLIKDITEKAKKSYKGGSDSGDSLDTRKTDSKIGDPVLNAFKSGKEARSAARDADSMESYREYRKSSGSSSGDTAAILKSVASSPVLRSGAADTVASLARKTPTITKTALAAASLLSADKAAAAYDRVANPKSPLQRLADSVGSEESRTTSRESYSTGELDSKLGMTGGRTGIERNVSKYDDSYTEDDERKRKLRHDHMSGRTIQVYVPDYNYLAHHGIRGQKWGRRRFQNEDGTLTEAGKKHNRGIDIGIKIRNPFKKHGSPEKRETQVGVARKKNVTGTGKVKSQKERERDKIPVQQLNTNSSFSNAISGASVNKEEDQPVNTSLAAYDIDKEKQEKLKAASFSALAPVLGKSLIDSAKFIASGYVKKLKTQLDKMISNVKKGIEDKVREQKRSRLEISSYTPKTHTIKDHKLSSNITISSHDVQTSGRGIKHDAMSGRSIRVYVPDYVVNNYYSVKRTK